MKLQLQPWPAFFDGRIWMRLSRPPTSFGPQSLATVPRTFSTAIARRYRSLDVLQDASLDTFRQRCFVPERPAVFPRAHFRELPALKNWFQTTCPDLSRLNVEYLRTHSGDAFVPLELTQLPQPESTPTEAASSQHDSTDISFRQFHAPLSLFLDWMRMAETSPQSTRLYLAQCQLLDLPPALRQDFPTPELVAHAGRGDIYDTNVWIGCPPTYTPLHRDPNPNLFVQLAGQKVVRLLAPPDGQALFADVRRRLRKSGDREAALFRGEEMMQGRERALLDELVWGVPAQGDVGSAEAESGYEAHLEAGDGLFIPKGWWHSIKGVGEGATASVSVLVYF